MAAKVVKIKSKKLASDAFSNLQNIFDDIPDEVAREKIMIYIVNIRSYKQLINHFLSFSEKNLKEYEGCLISYFTKCANDFAKYEEYMELLKTDIKKSYISIKNSSVVLNLFHTYNKIIQFKDLIISKELSIDSIRKEHVSIPLFQESDFDLKMLFDDTDISDDIKKYMLQFISIVYTLGTCIYNVYSTPDMNVEEFSGVLLNGLSDIQKHIPRCEKGFKILKNSGSLLKNNFNSYYKDYLCTGNSTIILENYVNDVLQEQSKHKKPTVQRELREILKFLIAKATDAEKQKNSPLPKEIGDLLNLVKSKM